MARRIKILDFSYFNIDVVLDGSTYNLQFKFNESDLSWYMNIRDSSKNSLARGIKIMPNQNLTKSLDYLDIFPDGDLFCIRSKASREPLGRDNFGVGLTYELVFLSSSESSEGGLNGIQL